MNIQLILLAGLSSAVLSACSQSSGQDRSTNYTGGSLTTVTPAAASLPSLPLWDATGNTVSLHDLKGKKVFVNLWASWCPPCRREMPSIERLYRSVDTSKVAFVMLALDERFETSARFMEEQQLELPLYYPAENLPPLFQVQGIPATFIFNEAGELVRRIDGGDDYDTQVYRDLLK